MNTRDSINPFKDDMTGRLLLGRYRILRRLATGGMGVVYLARSEGAAGFVKPVVVKLILPLLASNQEFSGMFAREARILANMQHPGIVSVIEFAEELDCYIMVLEYVHGFQLAEWKKYLVSKGQVIPTNVVIQVVINVLDALHYAHTLKDHDGELIKIIHRDISPANIMLDLDGHIKLVDFGIAFVSENTEGFKTTNQSFKGKLSYSAPELFSNQKATVRSDVYSCGITLHEILVGKNEYFFRDHASIVNAVLKHVPSSVHLKRDDAPAEIDEVIWKAVAKKPEQRYKSAAEFADALRSISAAPEHQSLATLTELVRHDFSEEMSDFLGVESLRSRGRAWRTPSLIPTLAPPSREKDATSDFRHKSQGGGTDPGDRSGVKTQSVDPPYRPTPMETPAKLSLKDRDQSVLVVDKSSLMPLYLLVGLLFVAIVAVLVVVFLNKPPEQKKPILLVQSPAAGNEASPNHVIASQQNGTTTVETPAPVGADEAPSKTDQDKAAAEKKPSETDSTQKKMKRHKKEADGPDMNALTQAFKKKKGKIQGCFEQYPQAVGTGPKISVLFHLAPSGKVNDVDLSPSGMAASPLGKCLVNVSKSTVFPGQGSDLSFRIPLSAHMVPK